MKTWKTILLIVSVLAVISACKQRHQMVARPEATTSKSVLPDTIHIGKHILQLDTASEADFLKLSKLAFDTSELTNLQRDSQWVKRSGDTLFFVTDNSIVTLTNVNSDDDSYSQYDYWGRISGINQYLSSGSFYEWYNYFLISSKTGDTTILWGAPEVSPDSKKIISVNADIEAGFTNNGIQIFDMADSRVIHAGEKEIDAWGPEEVRWINNHQAILKIMFLNAGSGKPYRYGYLRLTIK